MIEVVSANNFKKWRKWLDHFERVDVCHLPEYHVAYSSRTDESEALMWCFKENDKVFAYPFLYAPVILKGPKGEKKTEFFDISGIYGFSGPLANCSDQEFLNKSWNEFSAWAKENKVICEFIRFSVYANNTCFADSNCIVEENRPISVSLLPNDSEAYLGELNSKTRNMIRRALREGLTARQVDFESGLKDFRALYEETMIRNQATSFFSYDDEYYQRLLELPKDEITLYGVYQNDEMVAAAIALIHKQYAFYHLGASKRETSKIGSGNLVLFEMASDLIKRKITYLNVGGGRTTASDDPLFSFKKNNGTSIDKFYIGKRIINEQAYKSVVSDWTSLNQTEPSSVQLQFYR